MRHEQIQTLLTIALAGFTSAAPAYFAGEIGADLSTRSAETDSEIFASRAFDDSLQERSADIELVERAEVIKKVKEILTGKKKTYQCPYCGTVYNTFDAAKNCSQNPSMNCRMKFRRDLEARESDSAAELVERAEVLKKVKEIITGKKKTYQCPYCGTVYNTFDAAKNCSQNPSMNCRMKFRRDLEARESDSATELVERAEVLKKVKEIITGKKKTYQCPYCGTVYNTFDAAKNCSQNPSMNCRMKFRRDVEAREADSAAELVERAEVLKKVKEIITGKKKTYQCPYCGTVYNTFDAAKNCSQNPSMNCRMKFRRDLEARQADSTAELVERAEVIKKVKEIITGKKKTYQCPYCGTVYNTFDAAKNCSQNPSMNCRMKFRREMDSLEELD